MKTSGGPSEESVPTGDKTSRRKKENGSGNFWRIFPCGFLPTSNAAAMHKSVRRGQLCLFVLTFLCIFIFGCATPKQPAASGKSGFASYAETGKAYLLYRLNSPYRRLYVEIDSVKGCEPSDATLGELRKVLTNYCDKPEGIQIVRNPPIPATHEPGLSAEQLACRVMKGPPINATSAPPAFMEVLFYDSALLAESKNRGNRERSVTVRHPQTDTMPYPVILMNTRYFFKNAECELLEHEAGHILGLVVRTNDATDGHCLNPKCIMYKNVQADFHLSRYLRGDNPYTVAPKDFCPKCVAELESDAQSPPSKLRFAGPVLVRSENGYDVLALPDYVKIIVGGLTNGEYEAFSAAARKNTARFTHYELVVRNIDPATFTEIAERVSSDPYIVVRHAMAAMCLKAELFTNAIDIYRRSIQIDPGDATSHNGIAWIKATCPDSSLRDGRQATCDARKACELSQWKNADFIDTLAAAYAEAADFKRAVHFENQALQVIAIDDSRKEQWQKHLGLYRQSMSLREP